MIAAKNGPNGRIGDGKAPRANGITGSHEMSRVRTEKHSSGWRAMPLTPGLPPRSSAVSDAMSDMGASLR